MFQLVRSYEPLFADASGRQYQPRVYGDVQPDGSWDGWLVFFPVASGVVIATDRETTQPSLATLVHWTSTITRVYLQGALTRALRIQREPTVSARLAELSLLERRAAEEEAALEAAASRARAEAAAATLDADRHEAAAVTRRAQARKRSKAARAFEDQLAGHREAEVSHKRERQQRAKAADIGPRRTKSRSITPQSKKR